MTEIQVRPPKARLLTLGPILMPLVMPPNAPATALETPSRTSNRSPSPRSSPGGAASLAHNSASIEAMIASARAPDTITGTERASGSAIASGEKSTSTLRIAALAVSGPMTGPSCCAKPANTRP